MSYHHLTPFERGRIETLSKENYSITEISKRLHRDKSTISRELKRLDKESYQAEKAQIHYQSRRQTVGRKSLATTSLLETIQEKLADTWSPEQIAERLLEGKLSFKTIYRWIYAGILTCGVSVLRQKGKRRKPQEKRGKFLVGISIHKRPKSAKKRMEIGHWEADTMVSSRGKSKGCFATFADRRSRLYLAVKIPSRSAKSMEKAINWLIETLGKDCVRSITTDRGKEFACYKQIEKKGVPVYFADPYCAWQRGTNENCNGLLREFFPKKTDLAKVDEYELVDALIKINQRPRKCLGWKTPIELFQNEVLHLI